MRRAFYLHAVIILLISAVSTFAQAQTGYGSVEGIVTDEFGAAVEDVNVVLDPGMQGAVTDARGGFVISLVPFGSYTVAVSHLTFTTQRIQISISDKKPVKLKITLSPVSETLQPVQIIGNRTFQSFAFLPKVEGTHIFAGKKNEVISMQGLDADVAENLPRQIFSKVPGVMVWEMDGTGNQVGISTRGLIPHRSWELHVQQNGNTTNSDLFGYPESHYNPPIEAVGEIRVVRGSGALQYGPQFGGLLNYEIKQPDTTRAIGVETQQSIGSFGLFGSYNAIGGKTGKLTYYGYYNFRRADGWRENSDYHFNAWHASVQYEAGPKLNMKAELSHMEYINHFAAGLTPAMFEEDPRQSNRPRNYFSPTMYIPSLSLAWQAAERTLVMARTSAVLGERNSVQFIALPTVDDTINAGIPGYNPRQVDRDYYHSYASEVRVLHRYPFLQLENHVAAGVRYNNCSTDRRQQGAGTSGTDFDLWLTSPYRIDLEFNTKNYAFFIENVFSIMDNLSFTPGMRYELLQTEMHGEIFDQPALKLPFALRRNVVLFGAGIEYDMAPAVNFYANFTQNFRPVLHSDLIPPTQLDRIDPDLEDAVGNNAEAGVRGTLGDVVRFDVNYFRLQYDNRIGTLILNDDNETYFFHTNIGDMVNHGFECYIEFHPLNLSSASGRRSDLSLFTSTAFNSAAYKNGTITMAGEDRDVSGNRVENVPQWISRNGLTYRRQKLSATLQLSYVSSNFSDALNTVSTQSGVNGIVPSYLLADINATWHFAGNYNIRCSVNNLTDKMYYTRRATGYPGPGILPSDGRSFVLSFGAEF